MKAEIEIPEGRFRIVIEGTLKTDCDCCKKMQPCACIEVINAKNKRLESVVCWDCLGYLQTECEISGEGWMDDLSRFTNLLSRVS